MSDVVVHHLEHSRSQRVLWLLEELGVDYRIEHHKRNPRTMRATGSLKAVHPLGKAPLVALDGEVLAESGAILEALVERCDGSSLVPGDPTLRQRCRYWLHYAEGSLMSPLLVKLITTQITKPPVPFFVRPLTRAVAKAIDASYTQPEIDAHLGWIERSLGEHVWFAGPELSIADIQMSYPLEAVSGRVGLGDRYPNIAGFVARCRERPAYQRAEAKVGDFGIPG